MRGRRGIRLLEPGLVWPPETFVGWKLEQLAARGYEVTAGATATRRQARIRPGGVAVQRQPSPWEESRARLIAGIARDLLLMALIRPRRVRALLDAVRDPLRPPGWKSPWATLARLRSYLPLARLRPDVVHFEWNSAAIHYLPLLRVWGCPAVISCHGSDVNIRPHTSGGEEWRTYLKRSFEQAAAVHCVSETIAERAQAYGMDPATAWVIRPAVDPQTFEPHGPAPPESPRVLRVVTVADFRWLKAHEYALQAIRHLLDAGVPVRLEIAGSDPNAAVGEASGRDRLEHTICDLGLEAHVRLLGRVSSDDVRRSLAGADVLLHVSLSEGIPTSVLEAGSCALPVVVSDCGGMREAVTDRVEGIVVPLRDSRAAAAALERIWEDPEGARAMGEAGRRRVVSGFALGAQVDAFAELYEHVVNGGPAPARAGVAPAVPPPAPREPAGGRDCLRIVGAGPLTWRRGYEHALHAVRLLVDRGIPCEFRILGDGEYLDALRFARHQLGIEGVVPFLSPDREPLPPLLAWGDVFLDASVADEESPALDEALANGMAVVSTSARGGEPVPRRDPHALADALALHAAADRATV